MLLKNVMIVDDSEPDHFLSIAVLKKYNPEIEVIQAYDGEEALEMLRDIDEKGLIQPEVIFLDINMPRMDGFTFLDHYSKEANPSTVVVMLTSSDQDSDRERAKNYPFVKKFMTKPICVLNLSELVEKAAS